MLGLIVGESNLPRFLINKLLKKNAKFLILDLTKNNIYKKYKNSYSLKITQLGKYLVKIDRRGLRYVEKYTDMVFRIKNRDEAIEYLNYIDFLNMSEEDYQAVRIELNETI